ncbi:MAG: Succinate dehydrogenase cytochrome b556 subunit [Pseudomonadota bacterium]|jgi:succinate dehydrogenase / fumarate reductase cytochrome b subunit
MNSPHRPLSPHLQIYKLPLTGFISISHRISGAILAASLVVFVYSFYAIAVGNELYLPLQSGLKHPIGQTLLWLWVYLLFLHLCHGIRHLIWDIGLSFEKSKMNLYAAIEIAISIILTLIARFLIR